MAMVTGITNVNILTMNKDKEIIENGVVVIKNDVIVEIGDYPILEKYAFDSIIDGGDGILIPGMINAHTHVSMSVFRSLGDDIPDRLTKFLYPLEKELVDADLVYTGAMYGIAEMLLGGVTTFADMYFFEDEVAKAAKEMNVRAVLGETVLDFPSPDSSKAYGGLEYAEKFIRDWSDDELVTPCIAPHSTYSLDEEHMIRCSELSEKYNVPMMMHVAEMPYEMDKFRSEYNMTPVEYLDSLGVLNNKLIGAHFIFADDNDISLLKANNVGISHNIGANIKAAKGVAPAYKMYKDNLRIGLGTDGPMSGNTLDILTQMSLVPKLHKLHNKDRTIVKAAEVVEMATMGGARALHMEDKIGSIEVGKKADLVIMETDSVNMQPIFDYYSVLVYSANPSNVSTVLVNGKIVVQDKKLKDHSLKELQKNLKQFGNKVREVVQNL